MKSFPKTTTTNHRRIKCNQKKKNEKIHLQVINQIINPIYKITKSEKSIMFKNENILQILDVLNIISVNFVSFIELCFFYGFLSLNL